MVWVPTITPSHLQLLSSTGCKPLGNCQGTCLKETQSGGNIIHE